MTNDLNEQPLAAELTAAQHQAEEYLNGWKWAKADYLNLKRETEQHTAEIFTMATAGLLQEFLPIYDNLKVAWQHVPDAQRTQNWVRGFEHIRNQCAELLKRVGVEAMKTVGEPFNPDYHDAVAHEVKEGFAPDLIFEEVTPGYLLHGKVLQAAKVKVAK